jgi:hypothetical protein
MLLPKAVVLLENVIVLAVLAGQGWLHSRAHWMTGPHEMQVFTRVGVLVLVLSCSALVLGVVSLPTLTAAVRGSPHTQAGARTWAYISLALSLAAFLAVLIPSRHG